MNVKRIAFAALALTAALPPLTGCSRNGGSAPGGVPRNAARVVSAPDSPPDANANVASSGKSPQISAADKAVLDAEQGVQREEKAGTNTAAGTEKAAAAVLPSSTARITQQAEAGAQRQQAQARDAASSASPAAARAQAQPSGFPSHAATDKGASAAEAAAATYRDTARSKAAAVGKVAPFAQAEPNAAPDIRYRHSFAPGSPPAPTAVYNPDMYVADTYIGGNGERDRLAKLIQAGVVLDGRRVKLEAFTHNYAQSFPTPQYTALNVSADTVQSRIIQSGAHTYLQIGLQAMKGELPRRPPLNLALAIDRSGSMRDEHKLQYAKTAAMHLVDSLTPADTFALVAFDDRADVLVPAQHVTDKARIRRLIAALQPGGNTNIYEGLSRAYAQVRKSAGGESVNRVILLSDGEVTVGVRDAQQFHRLAAAQADGEIETSAVGVGVEFNEDLMLSLARDGKGNYHFLKDGADTEQVFARELDELTHVVAKAVKLRVQLAPGVGLVRVLGAPALDARQSAQVKADEKKIDARVAEELGIAPDRQHAPEEPGIKMLIPAFYRGDSHVVMMEIKVPPQDLSQPQSRPSNGCKIADVSVKYKDLVTMTNRTASASVAVQYTPSKDDMIYSVNRAVKKNLLGFQTGEALTQAADLIAQGRVGEAVQKVDERRTVLNVAAQQWQDADLRRDGALLDRYTAVLAQLNGRGQLAGSDFGQYLKRSLTYNGYQMTR